MMITTLISLHHACKHPSIMQHDSPPHISNNYWVLATVLYLHVRVNFPQKINCTFRFLTTCNKHTLRTLYELTSSQRSKYTTCVTLATAASLNSSSCGWSLPPAEPNRTRGRCGPIGLSLVVLSRPAELP